ncbi:diguanylate cyclase, partial [Klebsiella pneumoniae]|nr:diguanylate cyclase [Klebsiella pneumoniae]
HWQRDTPGVMAQLQTQVARGLLEEPINMPVQHMGQRVGHIELTGQGGSLLRFLLSGLVLILVCKLISAVLEQKLTGILFSNMA